MRIHVVGKNIAAADKSLRLPTLLPVDDDLISKALILYDDAYVYICDVHIFPTKKSRD